ncbi:MAG: hypothetical protein HOP08_00655 [Cyclobacteriaceae bacterium]|nr:hypothetical protein [Cyclobacteriaceae bacterium]
MKEEPSNALLDFVLQVYFHPPKVDAVYHYLLARDSLAVISALPVERAFFETKGEWFDDAVFAKAVTNQQLSQRAAEKDLDVATTKMERLGIPAHVVDSLALNYVVFPDMISDFRQTHKTSREKYIESKKNETVFSRATDWIKSFNGNRKSR